jgi:hypothetical protein
MSERETATPSPAPRPFQVGAATPIPAAAPLLRPPAPLPVSAAGPAGLDLRFGSVTREILASASTGAVDRRVRILAPGSSSRASADLWLAGEPSRPAAHLGAAAALGRGRAACSANLPPPPPLMPGDRPCTLSSLEAQGDLHQARTGGARIRSIIVAPKEFLPDLSRRGVLAKGDFWQEVRPKHWWRKLKLSPSGSRHVDQRQRNSRRGEEAQIDLFKGACFRCSSTRHFVRHCKGEFLCLECKEPGHRARACPLRRRPPPPPVAPLAPQAYATVVRMPSRADARRR